jgi:hypothetical protein
VKSELPEYDVVSMTDVTVRALARDGHMEQAFDLLNLAVVKEDAILEAQTVRPTLTALTLVITAIHPSVSCRVRMFDMLMPSCRCLTY